MAIKRFAPEEKPVEEKLKMLYQLQTVLSEIDRIRTLRGELPLEVEDLEDEIEGLKTRIEKNEADVQSIRTTINEYKTKGDLAASKVATYKEQLEKVRNNREYDTLNKEIEFQELELALCNKRIKECSATEKAKEELLAATKETLETKLVDLDHKQEELETIVEETKADEERLREKAKDLELQMEPRLLASFKRIRKNSHNGLGIVYVQRDACGGCFSKIPPQKQLDVRLRKKVIVCEYCGRILIDPELAGVKIEAKPEGEKKRRSSSRSKRSEE